ncbi:MAG: hypothetical protein QM751_13950 [Paludibacteraceae bacterium]
MTDQKEDKTNSRTDEIHESEINTAHIRIQRIEQQAYKYITQANITIQRQHQ